MTYLLDYYLIFPSGAEGGIVNSLPSNLFLQPPSSGVGWAQKEQMFLQSYSST